MARQPRRDPEPLRPFRIFLSSPGDVAGERAQARDLLLGLARGPYVRDRVHIDVVSWDDPHAPAQMDGRLSPQAAVDRSLPTPDACDLTIVLLWSRMGTPLAELKADGTPYASGTEWELEKALAADTPVLLYRRTEKVLLDPDDADFEAKLAQKRRVDAFFAGLIREDGSITMATTSYASPPDLMARLRQDVEAHLAILVRPAEMTAGAASSGAGTSRVRGRGPTSRPPDVPVAYRQWVKAKYGDVDLLGLKLKKSRPSLSAIYVPQTTSPGEAAMARLAKGPQEGSPEWGRAREQSTLALSRLATESLYISGAPGTGKSTFCRWVAWLVAEGAMPAPDVAPHPAYAETVDDGLKGRLPLMVRLRGLWEFLPARAGAGLTRADLEAALALWIAHERPDGLDAPLMQAHLDRGTALLILDGVDEVPTTSRSSGVQWHPRQQLLAALADACPAWCRAGNRLLLTSRPYGVSSEQATRTHLGVAPLNLLPVTLQRLLAQRWFTVLAGNAVAGGETAADLFSNIDSQPWLVELAANPLLLTAMCIVYDEGRRLPQDKHELYERVVATVLHSRYTSLADIEKVKRELGVIAYGMHTGAGIDGGRATPKAEATFHEIERWLQAYQDRKEYKEAAEAEAFEARDTLLSQSGLLLATGEDRASFAHLSFQEFFAAQRGFTVDEPRLGDMFRERAVIPDWRNTLSFLFGRLVGMFPEPQKAIDLLEAQLEHANQHEPGLLLVLSDAAQILMGKGIALRSASLQRLERALLDEMVGAAPFPVRAEMASAIGRLGDPRFDPARWWLPNDPLLGFLSVEAGSFLMGSDPAQDPHADLDEQPQHEVDVSAFYIARYPVTVGQFRAFATAARWTPADADCLRGQPNHPVASLSLDEMLAYCGWLTEQLRASDAAPAELRDRLVEGWVITLPSEAEWEKAARGTDSRLYPWGATFDDSKVWPAKAGAGARGTKAVGLFPAGASPYGAEDMVVGVWECTRSMWGPEGDTLTCHYPYTEQRTERESLDAPRSMYRVLRGRPFTGSASGSRVANREWGSPRVRLDSVGFRVACCRLSPLA